MACGWEGNRGFGITDFSGLSAYWLKAQVKKMNNPSTLLIGYDTLYLVYYVIRQTKSPKQIKH